jgi:hypothetical protein
MVPARHSLRMASASRTRGSLVKTWLTIKAIEPTWIFAAIGAIAENPFAMDSTGADF